MTFVKQAVHQRQNLYLACEDLDFTWDEREIPEIEKAWMDGISIHDIAKACDRDPDEVLILIIDRAGKGHIQHRPGGLTGRRMPT